MAERRTRWWWYSGIPVAILVGAVLAIWLRTSDSDRLTLQRGEWVDAPTLSQLDPRPGTDATVPGGKYLVVVFGYTSCPDVCPTTLHAVATALRELKEAAASVVPVFVTVDSARDTAAVLSAYVGAFDPRIRSISDPVITAATMRAYRVRAEKRPFASGEGYAMDHTAVLYVVGPGREVMAALPEAVAVDVLVRRLVETIRAGQPSG